jgi:hypothetical protein
LVFAAGSRRTRNHLAVVTACEERRKRAPFFGNKPVQQIGFACGQQLSHLFGLDRTLQMILPERNRSCAVGPGRFLADISDAVAEYLAAAFGAATERLLSRKSPAPRQRHCCSDQSRTRSLIRRSA